jgi:hypothetical protein
MERKLGKGNRFCKAWKWLISMIQDGFLFKFRTPDGRGLVPRDSGVPER